MTMDFKLILSPKPKRPCPPKLVYMHITSTPTCMNFFSQFWSIKLFDDHGMKGKFGHFESSDIFEFETREATPIKIGVHSCYIHPYLHKFFELILFDSIFLTPMDREFEENWKWAKSQKPKRPHPPNLTHKYALQSSWLADH